MGMGIAKLLIAHNYRVVTNIEGRRWDILFSSLCNEEYGTRLLAIFELV
jgi:hypothetical protein